MLRWLTAGESHGRALVAILEGIPAGVTISEDRIVAALARRRFGYGRGARMNFEVDEITVLGGLRHGVTLGSPIVISIANSEWDKWDKVMSTAKVSEDSISGLARNIPLTQPRPGHADLAGMQKYGFLEARPVLERASARETAARVALGSVVEQFLECLDIRVASHVVQIGKFGISNRFLEVNFDQLRSADKNPVRCVFSEFSDRMVEAILEAKRSGDTLGGIFEVVAFGVPPGLGSYVHWDRRLDSRIAAAVMSIPGVKGVEIGDAFDNSVSLGSEAHDEICLADDVKRLFRRTNRSGGVEGGVSNGENIVVRGAMKPIPTVPSGVGTISVVSGVAAKAHRQRSDVCVVPAAGIVGETMLLLVLGREVLGKFGGDSLGEVLRNRDGYLCQLEGQFF